MKLSASGIEEILEIKLSQEERMALRKSARTVVGLMKDIARMEKRQKKQH